MAGRDLYVFQSARTGHIKVGRADDVKSRMRQVQTGCPFTIRMLLHAPELGFMEPELHLMLRRYRARIGKGEWFTEASLGELPTVIYNKIPEAVLEDVDWWKTSL